MCCDSLSLLKAISRPYSDVKSVTKSYYIVGKKKKKINNLLLLFTTVSISKLVKSITPNTCNSNANSQAKPFFPGMPSGHKVNEIYLACNFPPLFPSERQYNSPGQVSVSQSELIWGEHISKDAMSPPQR